jgi:hypothetical protein
MPLEQLHQRQAIFSQKVLIVSNSMLPNCFMQIARGRLINNPKKTLPTPP